MKKIQPVILFCLIFAVAFFIWKGFFVLPFPASPFAFSGSSVTGDFPSSSPEEIFEIPNKLIIPKLGVNAEVESVGMDQEGRMDVPKGVTNVAWYNLGFKPGQTGSAVFAGHFDKPDGSPAIFYKLGSLKQGDMIEVEDKTGVRKFKVTEVRIVDLAKFPLQEVFGAGDKKRVNLITCGGVWDKQKKEYSKRMVVFSELEEG